MILITRLISYTDYNSFSGCDVVVSAQMAPVTTESGTINFDCHVLGSLQTISYSTHQDRAPIRAIGNINAIDYVQGQRTIAGTMVFAMFHEHWMTPLLEELENKKCVTNTDIWSDELPALNLTISMANEYGFKSNMVLYGVKFIDDGGVMSINDLYTENTLQYVATGIQPLKNSGYHQHGYQTKIYPFKISETDTQAFRDAEFYMKEWEETPKEYPKFTFDATIDPPNHVINEFVVKIEPDTKHEVTNLYLVAEDGTKHKTYWDDVHNEFVVKVPEGDYTITVEDKDGIIYENIWNIDVSKDNNQEDVTVTGSSSSSSSEKKTEKETISTDYPVICEIGDTSVKVLANTPCDYVKVRKADDISNTTEDSANMFKVSVNTNIGQSTSKEILVENLDPGTKYILNTYNTEDEHESASVTFKTYESKSAINDMFREYVEYNSDIHINQYIPETIFNSTEYEYINIVDSLLVLDNSDVKTELLFYGAKLQNELNKVYNDDGVRYDVDHVKSKNVDNEFSISDKVQSIVVYKRAKDRSYYVEKANPSYNYRYIGKPNIRYYLQPTLKTNMKSSRVDFVCFTQEQSEFLEKYTNVNNLDKMALVNHSYTYDKYNKELYKAIKAVDNMTLYKNLIGEPYAELHEGTLVVDIDCFNSNENNAYFLCIATPDDAVDYTPINKIKIDNKSLLQLDKYKTRILKDKYYLLWIQDINFNNISPVFILSSYENDMDIQDYYCNKTKQELHRMAALLPSDSMYKRYFNNAASVILAEENYNYNNLLYTVLQTIYSLYVDDMSVLTLDDVFIETINACRKYDKVDAKLIKDNDVISYVSNNEDLHISYIIMTESNIIKNSSSKYEMHKYNDGYTVLYLTDKKYGLASGCIVINNKTKEIYSSNITLEVMN